MQPNSVGLISARSSSVSLAIPQEPIDDDRSIARGLLDVASHEKSSLTRNAVSLQGLDGGRPRKPDILITSNNFPDGRVRRAVRTSNTWTSSEGDVLEDEDEIDDRTVFVEEYNRLAKKHGVRIMKVEDYEQNNDEGNNLLSKPGWFKRILRRTSSSQSVKARPDRQVKHRRSISDLSLRLKMKKDKLKDKDLQELVRLCGSSILYLPAEYAAGCLSVPTCFRATAQYLVQYGIATRGVFRIPGSHNVVAALYNHYCSMDEHGQVIAGTVRCPTLPDHIKCDVHDVASAFKKFLSGLPGGILGSLSLLDAFISIQTQLAGQGELTRTKQSKVRARLIALAIATLRSQYRRELICAVFGLLCMIGRTAETAQREDSRGRPLPTSDLMGYGPLGIVFGPLLVGDLLEDYSMRLADPYGGLVLLPISPPKSRKERQKKSKSGEEGSAFNTHVDKIKVANSITEMLITHWRDVVRHMRSLNALKSMPSTKSLAVSGTKQQVLRPSASESFALRRPPNWSDFNAPLTRRERSESPTPTQRPLAVAKNLITDKHSDTLAVRKQRSGPRPMPNRRLSVSRSMNILSPTIEETAKDDLFDANFQSPKAAGAKGDISTCDSEEDSQPLSNITFPALKVEENTKREGPSIQKAEFRPVALLHQTNVDCSPSPDTLRSPTPGPSVPRGQESERPRPPHFGEHTHLIIPNAQHGKQAELAAQTIPNRVSDLFEVSTNMQELHLPSSDVSKNTLEVRIPEPIIEIKDIKENRISVSDSEVTEEIKIVEQHTHNTMLIHLPNDMPHDNSTPSLALSSMFNPKNSGFKSVLNPETQEPKTPRRTGGSEPNIPLQSSNKLDRRISKSLYEDPKRKRNLLDWSKLPFQKDPLLRVSEQEDAASLAALAQVMDADMDADYEKTAALPTPRSTAILSTGDSSSEDQSKQTTNHRSTKSTNVLKKSPPITGRGGSGITAIFRQENRRSRADSSQNVTPARSTDVDNSFHSKIPAPAQNTHRTYLNNSEVKQEPAGSIESKRHSDVHGPRLSISDQAKTPTSVLSTRTGETSPKKVLEVPRRIRNSLSEEARTTKRLSSPGKISALVARFNGNSTPPPFSTKSPVKTPVKLTPGDPRDLAKSPGESLLAPYTTNGSSPTKSQKSSRSEKAQQARGSPVPREQTPKLSLLDSALVDSKTPKRILRSSLNDPTPLRPTRRAIEIDSSTATRPSPRPSMASRGHLTEKAAEYQSQKSLEGLQEPKPSQNVIESPQGPVPKFFEDSFGFSQQPASARYPSATWRLRQDSIDPGPVSPRKTPPSIASLGSSSQVYYRPPKSFRSAMETARAASPVQSLVDVPAFDGPGSIDSSVERVFPRHKRSSAIQSVPTPLERLLIFDNDAGTANLVHSDSSFAFATSNSGSSRSSPPLRRGSVLQGHIKSLEQQIAEKTVEVNHFRSQVEILRTIDLKRLGEELLRARMEAEMWKSRAEAAERKLQEMNPRSILKRRTTGSSVKRPSPLRSSTESSATEGAQLADKIRQALRGMDGAESSQHETYESDNTTVGDGDHSRSWNSEESTDTVLREVKQRYSGSEYSSWAGHNNQALEPTVSP